MERGGFDEASFVQSLIPHAQLLDIPLVNVANCQGFDVFKLRICSNNLSACFVSGCSLQFF